MPRRDLISLVGTEYGDKRVLEYVGAKRWIVQCRCGVKSVAAGGDLRRGRLGRCSHPEGAGLRFWRMVDVGDGLGCWIWTGSLSTDGYGRFRCERRSWLAHRWLYESVHGPVPRGFELDHTCRNRRCVRPSHLDPVTHRENVSRGNMPSVVTARGFAVED